MEKKPGYFTSTDRPPAQLDPALAQKIAHYIALIHEMTGWGELVITFKYGRVDEIRSTVTEKVKEQ